MILRRCSLLLLLCIGLTGKQNSLDQAWAAAANGDRVKAISLAKTVLEQEPGNADAHFLLGSLLTEEGRQQEAITELEAGVHLQPKSADGWNALGEAYTAFGKNRQARDAFEHAVQLKPDFGVAQLNLGSALENAGDQPAATQHLDHAIELLGKSPDAADAHYYRAKIYNASGESSLALNHLESAVKLRDQFAPAWSDLGEARRVNGDLAGALAAFQRAVELAPDDAVAQYRLGAEYLRRDQMSQSLQHLRAAYKLAPEDQSTLNSLQSALRLAGQPEEAAKIKQALAAVLRKRDLKSQADLQALKLNNQGSELERGGKILEASGKYREALDLSPDHNGIRVNYATSLLRLGRWAEGLEQLHQASLNDPENHDLQIALKDAVAQAPRTLLPEWARTIQ